jgi:hypothetical protein
MTPKTRSTRDASIDALNAAHAALCAAAGQAANLQGWAGQYDDICQQADGVQALIRRCLAAPDPTGHDYDQP